MPKKPPNNPIADQFSDDEMDQIKRHGQALGGEPTDFDEQVEDSLNRKYAKEAGAAKMEAARTGGASVGLGPSEMEQAQVKQTGALQQQAATQGAVQASQAQGAQTPVNAPPAPTGPAGSTTPYPAQKGPQPPPGATAGLPEPGEAPQGGPQEEGPEE